MIQHALDQWKVFAADCEPGRRGPSEIMSPHIFKAGTVPDRPLYEGKNPADRIKKFPKESRQRFIQSDEMPALMRVLSDEVPRAMKPIFCACCGPAAGVMKRGR